MSTLVNEGSGGASPTTPSPVSPSRGDDPSAALELSGELYLALLQNMTEGVSLSDEDGTIVYTNPAEDRMFGYQLGELVGQHVSAQNAYPPEENARLVGEVIAELKRSGAWRGEWLNRRKDGSTFVTSSRITAVALKGRRYWLCIQDDITEERASLAALKESRAELGRERDRTRSVLEGMAEGFVLLGHDLTVMDINAEGLAQESRSRDEIVGRTLWDVWPNTKGSTLGLLWERALADRVPVSLEHCYRWDEGREAWIDMRAFPVPDGLAIFYRDVTERKQAERELTELNEQIAAAAVEQAAILSQLAEGVIVTDVEGRITFVNEAAERLHGVKLLGVGPNDYTDAYRLLTEEGRPYPPLELPLARAVLRGETVTDQRWKIARADGVEILAIGSATPCRDSQGKPIGAILTMRDDTVRHEAEDRLRDLNETLESRVAEAVGQRIQVEEALRQSQKMDAVGQLTGGIAHDFNNMLAVVVGSLDLLDRKLSDLDPRAVRYLKAAQEGALRATALTARLLAFSRQQTLRPKPLDANQLVSNMIELLQHALGADVRLETLVADLWRVHADENQLENAILNLAVNARDAMPDGGKLTIETQCALLDDDYVAAIPGLRAGQYVMISVTDTGSGMPPEVVAKAFDPFFTTKNVGKGTGLGLSQVYGFVKQSGGHVAIDSELGQGTSIKLYLPRFEGPWTTEDNQTHAPARSKALSGKVILVVDDEPAVRSFSVDALIELGYSVLEADNATDALALLEEHPDLALLFTDVVMPEVNGRKLADEARRRRPQLPVLFTTGYSPDAIVRNGVLDSGVRMIGKPFTVDELGQRVREALDAAEAERTGELPPNL